MSNVYTHECTSWMQFADHCGYSMRPQRGAEVLLKRSQFWRFQELNLFAASESAANHDCASNHVVAQGCMASWVILV